MITKKNQYKNRKRVPFVKYFLIGIFFSLLGVMVYFLIWSPYFWIKSIEVQGDVSYLQEIKQMSEEKISSASFKGIPLKSIFLIPINKIRSGILDKYPEIRMAEIKRHLPDSLSITIEKREKVGIWCQIEYLENDVILNKVKDPVEVEVVDIESQDSSAAPQNDRVVQRKVNDCFYFDNKGVVFKETPLIKGSLVLNVYGRKNPVEIRDEVMDEKMVDFILNTKNQLPEAIDFEIVSLEDLRANTNSGWKVYLNPSFDSELQVEALRTVIEKEVKENLNSVEYFDLRIQGRVYYK